MQQQQGMAIAMPMQQQGMAVPDAYAAGRAYGNPLAAGGGANEPLFPFSAQGAEAVRACTPRV
jgi:hypothetical protein